MNALVIYRKLAVCLEALLRATGPSGDALTGADSLEHSRACAEGALRDAYALTLSGDGPILADLMRSTEVLLRARMGGVKTFNVLVYARCAAWDALDATHAEIRRLETEASHPLAGLSAAECAHHQAVHLHEGRVAAGFDAALAREPGLTARAWADRHPFVPPAA